MGVCRRAALYLARKRGKSLLLFLVFFAVSALLLLCVSVLEGTGQAARELRSSVGASFTIRPYAQMTLEEGEITQAAAPVVSQESIDQILAAAQGQVKAYNTEQYGYAKSQQLHFLPGSGDNTASNMGQVTAVRDSQLLDMFREEEYTLLEGRHIQPEDQGAILISAELAAENGLAVGDSVTLTHAGPGAAYCSSPAASSSGWPSPGPWPARPPSSWPTSPPAAWTRTPPRASPPFCGKAPTRWASAWWWSPTPGNLPGRPT